MAPNESLVRACCNCPDRAAIRISERPANLKMSKKCSIHVRIGAEILERFHALLLGVHQIEALAEVFALHFLLRFSKSGAYDSRSPSPPERPVCWSDSCRLGPSASSNSSSSETKNWPLPGSPCRPARPMSWRSTRLASCRSVPRTCKPPAAATVGPELDVGAAAGHVRGDRHFAALAGLGDDLTPPPRSAGR